MNDNDCNKKDNTDSNQKQVTNLSFIKTVLKCVESVTSRFIEYDNILVNIVTVSARLVPVAKNQQIKIQMLEQRIVELEDKINDLIIFEKNINDDDRYLN